MSGTNQSQESLKRIEFSQQQVSVAAAAVLMLIFCSFMAGYFFSPREGALEGAPFDLLNFEREATLFQENQDSNDGLLTTEVGTIRQEKDQSAEKVEQSSSDAPIAASEGMSQLEKRNEVKQYYAQLAGFGTVEAARNCVEKLKRHGVPARIENRESKTGTGKKYSWYHVVTEAHDSPDALADYIKRAKKLFDVKECALKELSRKVVELEKER